MINYTWKVLEIFVLNNDAIKVRYLLKAQDESNTVETEGYHEFSEDLVSKPISEIKESDLIGWLESDTIKDGVNLIKLAVENQLKALKSTQKIDFPWEASTFTIE